VPEWEDEAGEDAVARSFWSGTLTFGLVSIPVALYAANRPSRVSLRMVGPAGTPLGRRYFTSRDDRELDPDEIVRGYEVEKGRFVIVDDDELERLAPERTRDIDLRHFVKASEIDPMYFERAYYLTPSGSTKAYRLLAQVMEETGRAGIATFVMRSKEYLVAILAENGILRAETLRFADELRTPGSIGLPDPAEPGAAQVRRMDREIGKRAEARMAKAELENRSAGRLLKLVRDKVRAGDDVVHVEAREDEEGESDVIDLMEILKRRLQGAGDDEDEAPRAKKPAAKKPAAKKPAAKKPAAKSPSKSRAAKKPAAKSASKSRAAKKPAAKSSSKPRASRARASKASTKS
jgi:DNA end-binding protein Ku